MTFWPSKVIVLSGILLGTGVAFSAYGLQLLGPQEGERFDFFYAGDDNQEAAELLAKALRRAGDGDWTADASRGASILLTTDSGRYLISPKMVETGLDRIVIMQFFSGKDSLAMTNVDCLAFINNANATNNALTWTVDADGDFLARSDMNFRNLLAIRDFRDALDNHNLACAGTALRFADEARRWMD